VALLAGYWLALGWIPAPGHVAGDLSPEGSLAAWVDQRLLGPHIWRYAPGPADPEGILSTLGAIATALLGLFAGDWLHSSRGQLEKLRGLLLAGSAASLAGLLLGRWLPINKNLWTSTYVVFTAGAALLLLAGIYWLVDLVDLKKRDRWALPATVFGTNAIAAYAGSSLMARTLGVIRWAGPEGKTVSLQRRLYARLFDSWLPDYVASLAWALAFVAVWWALQSLLYRRRIFIKI
jgi:predicted acyltransferase